MSDTKAPENVVSTQPTDQAQPTTLSKLQASTGTEEWSDDIFNCFEGPDNLCKFGYGYQDDFSIANAMKASKQPSARASSTANWPTACETQH